jgi:flavin reductase (DIM6/NTAB) family NADH-FMN oxidoreductase RutF
MLTINPKEIPIPKMHGYLQSAVAPRPIAFASTIDSQGRVNLSPFSFFNIFSTNPPILIFSPSRRVRDNTTKHTYQNVKEVGEVVINVVNYAMVEQASLASCEFPQGVNEFEKAGFTELKSSIVKPPRVAESPVSFECKVNQVIELGSHGGAGNLIICEVILMHVKEEVLDNEGQISPFKLDAVARMGQNYYCRAQGDAIFEVPKPNDKLGIGYDQIPQSIRNSTILSKNDLGRLGNVERLPDNESIRSSKSNPLVEAALQYGERAVHQLAKQLLAEGKTEEAWKVLLAFQAS